MIATDAALLDRAVQAPEATDLIRKARRGGTELARTYAELALVARVPIVRPRHEWTDRRCCRERWRTSTSGRACGR